MQTNGFPENDPSMVPFPSFFWSSSLLRSMAEENAELPFVSPWVLFYQDTQSDQPVSLLFF